jgi:lantibiotic leader peptide-processing serine protease
MSSRTRWALVGAAFLTLGLPAQAAQADDRAPTDEFVVVFDAHTADLRAAVDDSGGRVLDVNSDIGVALVRSKDEDFLADMRGQDGVTGVVYNHAVGLSQPGLPHRLATDQPRIGERVRKSLQQTVQGLTATVGHLLAPTTTPEPLADQQWDMKMIGATLDGAHQQVTGAGVDVGIIDTGVDGRHPDIAPNFDFVRSRNFTVDRPSLDGPCESPTCIDPADVDGKGHGTHVAGTVAAARNGFGIAGVAPDARIVNLRAGQDSGYFFLYETVNALAEAGDLGLDVVNMSFYTDPWMYNCDGRDDYIDGDVTDDEIAQQALTRQVMTAALQYAYDHGVTMIAAAGNEHTDLSAPTRFDEYVPSATGHRRTRTVAKDCINLPSEGPHVISVGSVGPSGIKADYSNYGLGSIAVTAPGGWIRDGVGTPSYQTPGNLILSSYPTDAAVSEGLADALGMPVDGFSQRWCSPLGACGFYTGLQGTSMAAPHAVGVAALIIQRHGQGSPEGGFSLAPDQVAALMASTARDTPCPVAGVEDYRDEGRAAEWNAACLGSPQVNSLYGEGIVDATAVTLR